VRSPRLAGVLAAALIGTLLMGCGESPAGDGGPDAGDAVSTGDGGDGTGMTPVGMLVIGTTEHDGSGFLPFMGDHDLAPGSQGGFHIWLKFRISGVAAGRYKLSRTVRRIPDGTLLLKGDLVVDVGDAGPEGYWELPMALPSFICPPPLGVQVIDESAHFDVTLNDPTAGTLLGEAQGEVTMHCPMDDQLASCMRVCAP
jgi:hypothetical protein